MAAYSNKSLGCLKQMTEDGGFSEPSLSGPVNMGVSKTQTPNSGLLVGGQPQRGPPIYGKKHNVELQGVIS